MTNYYQVLVYANYNYGFEFVDPFDISTFIFPADHMPTESELSQWVVNYKLYQCKQEAKKRIAQYDWVIDTETTPDLLNREDFIAYRSALRQLILNPVENPVWPEVPQEEWA